MFDSGWHFKGNLVLVTPRGQGSIQEADQKSCLSPKHPKQRYGELHSSK